MLTIGEFARYGQVSIRMLRHYDALGLLHPQRTDPASGYRYYGAGQLARLNRIVALKELGFTLEQVGTIVDEQVNADELRGMLRLRRAELETERAAAQARLGQVEARLRTIESEGRMPVNDVVIKSLPGQWVAELSATAQSWEPAHIGPVIGPLFDRLCRLTDAASVRPAGPCVAYYEDAPEGGGAITVHAALPVDPDAVPRDQEFAVVHLPGVAEAATIVHRGPMEGEMLATEQLLVRWIEDNDRRQVGYVREVSLSCPPDDRSQWVTELQAVLDH
ncbi:MULTISPECIES: MerR family transcriptional regulator [unclassified Streptomyces]|uniref:MerR family transcriptional regulator n=1 Tax=unclassified Streptomyces TaxID=2593676 RepID=UPI0013BCBBC9|nr:MerR family transcriptional regulator [Streptomyces sp. SID7909]NEC10027.1 MerR family transcriptional regulator [Streptomyces sp. SID7909]